MDLMEKGRLEVFSESCKEQINFHLKSLNLVALKEYLQKQEDVWVKNNINWYISIKQKEQFEYHKKHSSDLVVGLKPWGLAFYELGVFYALLDKKQRSLFRNEFLKIWRIILYAVWQEKTASVFMKSLINQQFIFAMRSYFGSGAQHKGLIIPISEWEDLFRLNDGEMPKKENA